MKLVFILYETDSHHSKTNRVILSVCSSKKKAIKNCSHILKKKGIKGDDLEYHLNFLNDHNQTQNLEYNFLISEYELDKEL